jgi:NADP-dependent 3-hydroxy acid dehydrogenase YdfG
MLNVENKVIAITGASSGIGEATAKLLAQNGAKVVLGARRTDKLEKLVEENQELRRKRTEYEQPTFLANDLRRKRRGIYP